MLCLRAESVGGVVYEQMSILVTVRAPSLFAVCLDTSLLVTFLWELPLYRVLNYVSRAALSYFWRRRTWAASVACEGLYGCVRKCWPCSRCRLIDWELQIPFVLHTAAESGICVFGPPLLYQLVLEAVLSAANWKDHLEVLVTLHLSQKLDSWLWFRICLRWDSVSFFTVSVLYSVRKAWRAAWC